MIFLLMNCDGVIDAYIVIEICCPDSTGQRYIPNEEGRVGGVDNAFFIHAIVPMHVETVVLMIKE